jgi:hypothetical protein
MEVTRNPDGTYTLDAAIALNGTDEVLTGDIPNPYLSTSTTDGTLYTSDSQTPVDIKINEKKTILLWGDYGNQASCYGGVMLSAEDGVNVEPEAFDGHVTSSLCNETDQEQSITKHFGGRDRDGYIQGPGKLKVSGANEVVASSTYSGSDVTAVGTLDYASTFPYGTWLPGGFFDTFTIKRDCSEPVTWEYTVTDNEGASYTISGEIDTASGGGTDGTVDSQYGSVTIDGKTTSISSAMLDQEWKDISLEFDTEQYGLIYMVVYDPSDGTNVITDGTYQFPTSDAPLDGEVEASLNDPSGDEYTADLIDGTLTVSGDTYTISATMDMAYYDFELVDPGTVTHTFEATITNPGSY